MANHNKEILLKNSPFKKGHTIRVGMTHTSESKSKMSSAKMGSNNPNWKGGKSIKKDGYVQLRYMGKVYKEHRFVMEQHLGRKLSQNETVHHLNGIRSDNRIENLELWITPPTRGIRVKDAIKYAKGILERYGSIQDKL